jgi:hypothetical protein
MPFIRRSEDTDPDFATLSSVEALVSHDAKYICEVPKLK